MGPVQLTVTKKYNKSLAVEKVKFIFFIFLFPKKIEVRPCAFWQVIQS